MDNSCVCILRHLVVDLVDKYIPLNMPVTYLEICLVERKRQIYDGEITANITYLAKGSEVTRKNAPTDLEIMNSPSGLPSDEIDMDESWEPPVLNLTPSLEAETECKDKMPQKSAATRKCLEVFNDPLGTEYISKKNDEEICMEDIMITGGKQWVESSIDSLKENCLDEVTRHRYDGIFGIASSEGLAIRNMTCIHDCSGRGACVAGECKCNASFTGGDCSMSSSLQAKSLSLPRNGLCDERYEDCHIAMVFGEDIIESKKLVCFAQPVTATDSDQIRTVGNFYKTTAVFVSPSQTACVLQTKRDHYIKISNDDGGSVSEQILHSVSDSACYECTYGTHWRCARRQTKNHCIINGRCFAANQTEANNECILCDPTRSTSSFSNSLEPTCVKRKTEADKKKNANDRMWMVKGIVAISLCILVILITILLFLCHRRKPVEEHKAHTNGDKIEVQQNAILTTKPRLSNGITNAGLDMNDETYYEIANTPAHLIPREPTTGDSMHGYQSVYENPEVLLVSPVSLFNNKTKL